MCFGGTRLALPDATPCKNVAGMAQKAELEKRHRKVRAPAHTDGRIAAPARGSGISRAPK